jgi:hypothetical protein
MNLIKTIKRRKKMISVAKANKMLNELTGVTAPENTDKGISESGRWMGLCKEEPKSETGEVTTEPSAPSYSRVRITEWEKGVVEPTSLKLYFGSAVKGVAENKEEI